MQLRFHALTGNLPPRRSTWTLRAARRATARASAFARQLERAKASPAVPEWERIAQEMQLYATRAQRYGTPHRRGHGGARRARRRLPREAPLDAGATAGASMKRQLAAWIFVAPALAVIGLFFVVPVAAGLALSFTDFDLYALADLANLRFAGPRQLRCTC